LEVKRKSRHADEQTLSGIHHADMGRMGDAARLSLGIKQKIW
jgi:hypothetical protein